MIIEENVFMDERTFIFLACLLSMVCLQHKYAQIMSQNTYARTKTDVKTRKQVCTPTVVMLAVVKMIDKIVGDNSDGHMTHDVLQAVQGLREGSNGLRLVFG